MQIETERLRIRSLEVADAFPLAAIWSDPEVTRHMGGPRDFAAIREGLEEDAQAGDQAVMDLWTVVEKASGQVIGHCGFLEKDVDGRAEIELIYVFASDAWGKGYATEAALALREPERQVKITGSFLVRPFSSRRLATLSAKSEFTSILKLFFLAFQAYHSFMTM